MLGRPWQRPPTTSRENSRLPEFCRISKVICPGFHLVAIKFMDTELTDRPRSTSLTNEEYGRTLTRNDELVRMESC